MPATRKSLPKDGLPVIPFASRSDFETFLNKNHTSPGLHLKFAKKASGIPSITAAEAVETALCYGWIDGRANSLDEKYWLVRYTPRRAKSIWSQRNVETVTRLIEDGKMHEAGLKVVEEAKKDGRWDRAYAGPATILVPEDLTQQLEATPSAMAFFDSLNKSQRYSVLWRIEIASPKTRSKRIEALVQMLAMGNLPGVPDKPRAEPKKSTAVSNRVSKRTTKAKDRNKRMLD